MCGDLKTRVGQWCAFVAVVAALLPPLAGAQSPGRAVVDFQLYFPQFLAVSEEVRNKEFPQGVQYKFISIWDEQEQLAYDMVIRRDGLDHVLRILFAKGPLEGSEATIAKPSRRWQGRWGRCSRSSIFVV